MNKTKLIYNPHAGSQRRLPFSGPSTHLQDIHALLHKYEIEFDESPTTAPGDVQKLASEAAALGYDRIIVAGGDGTVGEAANGLIGSNAVLGILPLGTYMNVARMLSIPLQLEKAVMVIKMGSVRSIDVGEILSLEEERVDGKRVNEPCYFLESAGIGLEADFQKKFLSWKQGHWKSVFGLVKAMRRFYTVPLHVELDEGRSFDSYSHIIMVSNGPYMGAGLAVAGSAKLNDHTFTIHRYRMSKTDLLKHLLRIKLFGRQSHPDVVTYTSKFVRISSSEKRPVDADARVFGQTPVSLSIKPHCLNVIVGFPDAPMDSALIGRKTYLRPLYFIKINFMLTEKEIQKKRRSLNESDRHIAAIFKSLGDVTRFRIFRILFDHPQVSVSTIAKILHLSVPLTSQHVTVLAHARLLKKTRVGKKIFLSVDRGNPVVGALKQTIRQTLKINLTTIHM